MHTVKNLLHDQDQNQEVMTMNSVSLMTDLETQKISAFEKKKTYCNKYMLHLCTSALSLSGLNRTENFGLIKKCTLMWTTDEASDSKCQLNA